MLVVGVVTVDVAKVALSIKPVPITAVKVASMLMRISSGKVTFKKHATSKGKETSNLMTRSLLA